MMGYGYGMGVGVWIAMTIFWVAVITVVVWTLSRALPRGDAGGHGATSPRENGVGSAEDLLDRRFAAGELDEQTYRSMRTTLRSPRAGQDETR